MALDLTRIRALRMVTATDLQRLFDNLRKVKGSYPAQTETECHAPLALGEHVEFSGADGGDILKRYAPADGVATFTLVAEDAHAPSSIDPGYSSTVQQSLGIVGGAQQDLSALKGSVEADEDDDPRLGWLDLTAEGPAAGPDLSASPEAYTGIEYPVPEERLDVGAGTLNADEYRIDGDVVSDWTETPGPPDEAGWTGSALVSGSWRSLYHVLDPVVCKTTANITLSGEQTLDGVLTSADRVLVTEQTLAENNGVYVSAAGAWTRATDADTWAKLAGAAVNVTGGTVHAGENWAANIMPGGALGTDAIPWFEDTRANFGAPTDFTSDTVCPYLDAEMLNGTGWVVPKRKFDEGAYADTDTEIGAPVEVTAGEWLAFCVLTLQPDPDDVGLDVVCKLKNAASGLIVELAPISAKAVTVGAFTNSVPETVLLMAPYSAAGDDEIQATVRCTGGVGGYAEAVTIAIFVGP